MFLISGRFRRWLILLVVVPLGSWLLARIADRMGEQRGESTVTRALRVPQRWRHRHQAAA